MTIKCSVFGHRFGEVEVTREREERGSEVVTTITETETCERCGETRVVSENTEVTTLETPSDIVAEAADDDEADAGDAGDAPTPEEPDAPTPEGLINEAESPSPAAATPAGDSAQTGHGQFGRQDPAGEDDAVILDETADDDEDEPDGESREPGEWPDQTEAEDVDEGWVPDMTSMTETGTEGLPSIESEQPDIEQTGEAVSVPQGEFHCPECGFTTAVESSSLRRGDFCPECHRGALEHHSEE